MSNTKIDIYKKTTTKILEDIINDIKIKTDKSSFFEGLFYMEVT